MSDAAVSGTRVDDPPGSLAEVPANWPASVTTVSITIAVEDISDTVAKLADTWKGEPHQAVWDLMHPEPHTMQTVIAHLRNGLAFKRNFCDALRFLRLGRLSLEENYEKAFDRWRYRWLRHIGPRADHHSF